MRNYAFLIDDDPQQLKLGEFLIRRHTIFERVSCYLNATDALEYLSVNYRKPLALPDVILLDLDMPQLSGWQFLDLFNQIWSFMTKPIDVFIISSSAGQKAIELLRQYSFIKGAFLKPVSLKVLQSIVLKIVPSLMRSVGVRKL